MPETHCKSLTITALACALTVGAAPAYASEVQLPPGNLNGASNTCPDGAETAEFFSARKSWKLKPGQRLAVRAREGDDFKMKCVHQGVEISVGTGCFFDGYAVAGFEPGAMRIACYEGEIPPEWQGQ